MRGIPAPHSSTQRAHILFLLLDRREQAAFLIQALFGPLIRLITSVRQYTQVLVRQQRLRRCALAAGAGIKDFETFFIEHQIRAIFASASASASSSRSSRGLVEQAPKLALLNDEFLQAALDVRAFEEVLLDGAARCQAVDKHGFRLPDAVRAVLRLQVLLRVPVRVEQDHRVRRREVDALPASPGAEEEDPACRVRVERPDLLVAVGLLDAAVDAAALPRVQLLRPVVQDVELRLELRKYQDLMPPGHQARDEAVENDHLAGTADERRVDGVVFVHPWPVKVVRRIACQAGLYDRVLQLLC